MEDLEESWNRMALTEGEQEVVEVEDYWETEEEHTKYCLVGSLWTVKPFNHQAMMETMKTLWKPLKGGGYGCDKRQQVCIYLLQSS